MNTNDWTKWANTLKHIRIIAKFQPLGRVAELIVWKWMNEYKLFFHWICKIDIKHRAYNERSLRKKEHNKMNCNTILTQLVDRTGRTINDEEKRWINACVIIIYLISYGSTFNIQ